MARPRNLQPGKKKGTKDGRHPGKTPGRVSPTKRRVARLLAHGAGNAEAALAAGLTSVRARAGVTVSQWRKDPAFEALVKQYTDQQMLPAEINGRLAAEAVVAEKSRDRIRALDSLSHNSGLRRSALKLEGLDGVAAALADKNLIVVGGDGSNGEGS